MLTSDKVALLPWKFFGSEGPDRVSLQSTVHQQTAADPGGCNACHLLISNRLFHASFNHGHNFDCWEDVERKPRKGLFILCLPVVKC
jgi:hypothetical protein